METRHNAAKHHVEALRLVDRWPWLLVAAAWTLAIIATLTGQRALIDHHYLLEESGLPWPLAALVFLACWQVMVAAMMLPTSIPALALARGAIRSRAGFLAGYAALWSVFALLAFTGDTLIHRAVDSWPWLAAHSFLIGAATLVVAGGFQFTHLKARCLTACHDPRWLRARTIPASSAGASWLLGARAGLASAGCCWALMLVMFGIGVGGVGWMAALTAAMVVEERFAARPGARPALGLALALLAALWLLRPAWLPTSVS